MEAPDADQWQAEKSTEQEGSAFRDGEVTQMAT
jgi:hypothetical protein